MPKTSWKTDRDLIVFVNTITTAANEIVHAQTTKDGTPLRTACIINRKQKEDLETCKADVVIPCNFSSDETILKSILPYRETFLAITCLGEVNIESLIKLIPHVPYLRTPSTKSLAACVNKISMRKLLRGYSKQITPTFTVIHDSTSETIEKIEKTVGFPLVIKPAGLASSLLVSICYHREELEKELRRSFRKITSLYREKKTSKEPKILVEQFMDGEMYSIDAYVSSRGKIMFTPMVKVSTGRTVGFDDFFGYARITPTTLSKTAISDAQEVAKSCVHAIGLRNSTAHIELMKTDAGWKIIEIGARMGGYRHKMYELSFGINHLRNDVFNRIPRKLSVPTKVKSHTAVLEFFAKKEGYLTKLKGARKARKLASMHELKVHVKEGQKCKFAKHGGKRVLSAVLTNPKRSDLLADIRRLEKMIVIETSKKRPPEKPVT